MNLLDCAWKPSNGGCFNYFYNLLLYQIPLQILRMGYYLYLFNFKPTTWSPRFSFLPIWQIFDGFAYDLGICSVPSGLGIIIVVSAR